MQYDNIKKWFEIVIACSGSGSLIQMRQVLAEAGASVASQYIDDPEYANQAKAWKPSDDSIYYESFADDFDQLYRPEIISMVNWCVLSDVAAFYQLFDSFKDDIVDAFNSSDGSTNKQRLADRIAQQLYIVKAAADRLAATLKEKWGILNDPRQNHTILNQRNNNSHSSFVLLIAIIQNQLQQKQLAGQQPTTNGPSNLDRYKKPDQDYLYLALLLAQKTEDYLTNGGWLELYCSDSMSQVHYVPEIENVQQVNTVQSSSPPPKLKKSKDDIQIESFSGLYKCEKQLKADTEILIQQTSKNRMSLISSDGKWLGKDRDGSRSILIAWVQVIELRGRFKRKISNKAKANLLNKHFEGLNLHPNDATLWTKKDSEKINTYYSDFLSLIK